MPSRSFVRLDYNASCFGRNRGVGFYYIHGKEACSKAVGTMLLLVVLKDFCNIEKYNWHFEKKVTKYCEPK